jgi:hypothetical protein
MKITDIIRQVLDIVDAAEEQPTEPVMMAEPQAEPDALIRIQQIAGLLPTDDSAEYSNTPQERIAPVTAAFPAGDDVHHSKNPADIRTNAPSMFPGFQAGMR